VEISLLSIDFGLWHGDGINLAVEAKDVKFAVQVFGEAGDAFLLIQQRPFGGCYDILGKRRMDRR